MQKNLTIILFFISLSLFSQSFTAKISSKKDYPWSILYRVKNIKQYYIENKKPDSLGVFKYDMKNQQPGEYFLLYDMDHQKFFYFIYNNEDVSLEVFPDKNNKIKILKSKENKIYLPYAGKRDLIITMMDDIERKIGTQALSKSDKVFFENSKKNLDSLQQEYLKKSKGLLANIYIKNSSEYYPDINLDAKEYFKEKKEHYFDNFEFNKEEIKRSKILLTKIHKYVFNIDLPTNPNTAYDEYIKRIKKVRSLIKNEELKDFVTLYYIQSFVNVNGRVSKYLIENYYYGMPGKTRSQLNAEVIMNDLGLLEGEKAPDFSFTDLQKKHNLYDIKSKYTLLIFWSATCSHCLRAMPKIDKLMKDKKDFKVVAIALENNKTDWIREHYYYPQFLHGVFIDEKNKWGQPIVQKYHITATPTFFILDKDFKVLSKPYEVEDVKKVVETLENQ